MLKIQFNYSSIWPIDVGTTTPIQSGLGSNGNKKGLLIPRISRKKTYNLMLFKIIPRTSFHIDQ